MHLVAAFFAGAFLCNCLPHLAAGLQGHGFPTPFAKPRGVGFSSPTINLLWGAANLVAGLLLLSRSAVAIGWNLDFAAMLAGGMTLGLYLSHHFGHVMRERAAASSDD